MSIETRFKSIKPFDDTPKYPPAPKRYLFPDERTVLSIYSNLSMEIKEKLNLPPELATKIIDPWADEMYKLLHMLPYPESTGALNIASYFTFRVSVALSILSKARSGNDSNLLNNKYDELALFFSAFYYQIHLYLSVVELETESSSWAFHKTNVFEFCKSTNENYFSLWINLDADSKSDISREMNLYCSLTRGLVGRLSEFTDGNVDSISGLLIGRNDGLHYQYIDKNHRSDFLDVVRLIEY